MFGDVTSNPLHRSCRKYVEVVAFQTTVVMQSLKMAFFEIRASQLGICVRAIFELKFAHTKYTQSNIARPAPPCKLYPGVRSTCANVAKFAHVCHRSPTSILIELDFNRGEA